MSRPAKKKPDVVEFLREMGYTTQFLASQINISNAALNQIIHGKRPLSYKVLVRILTWYQGLYEARKHREFVEALMALAPPMARLLWGAGGNHWELIEAAKKIDAAGVRTGKWE